MKQSRRGVRIAFGAAFKVLLIPVASVIMAVLYDFHYGSLLSELLVFLCEYRFTCVCLCMFVCTCVYLLKKRRVSSILSSMAHTEPCDGWLISSNDPHLESHGKAFVARGNVPRLEVQLRGASRLGGARP